MVTGATSSGDAKKATLIESEGRMSLGKDFYMAAWHKRWQNICSIGTSQPLDR